MNEKSEWRSVICGMKLLTLAAIKKNQKKIGYTMKKILLLAVIGLSYVGACACTSAIVSGKLTANGRPLMWKNRDTGDPNNRVERHEAHDGCYEFVALFDSKDPNDTAAWLGMNEKGFAIMNTASYNLNHDNVPESMMDGEGVVMRAALEHCVTVDDFENLLRQRPKPLCVETNFGVMDAYGNAAYIETGNFGWKRYDLADEPSGILTRTNYSYSGDELKGMGYIRERNEKALLAPHIEKKDITPALFTEGISRTFYHSVLGKDFTMSGEEYVVDQDFIPRRISTASVVFEGVTRPEEASLTTMWISLGYPPCAETYAVWTGKDGVAEELRGTAANHHSPQCDKVNERKKAVFDIKGGNGKHYVHLKKLYNEEGTGYCQQLRGVNAAAYAEGYRKVEQKRATIEKK